GDSAVTVVASSVWGAIEGRRALNVSWDEGPNKDLNSTQIYDSLKKAASGKAASLYSVGDVTKASGRRITAAYQLPFMAHAPMEPGNCTAHYRGSNCELWAPTQVPQDVRDSVAQAVGLDPDQVKVNVTLAGGGFGRRLEHDYGVEAALVSKAISGPVQVLWTREDDMRNSTYRPASYHELSAKLDGRGWPAWCKWQRTRRDGASRWQRGIFTELHASGHSTATRLRSSRFRWRTISRACIAWWQQWTAGWW